MKLKASHGRIDDIMNISEEMEKTLVDELSKSINKEILKNLFNLAKEEKEKKRINSIKRILNYKTKYDK